MGHENISRLRANLETFNRTGEIDVDMLAADFEMRQASSIIDTAGVFEGPGALRASLDEAVQLVVYEEEAEALAAVGLGE